MKPLDAKIYGVLDSQSFKKIFPEKYFDKFAAHLKILEFEKNIFSSPPQPGKLKFTSRKKGVSAEKPQTIRSKTILTKFAKIPDTIENDRQEIVRFRQINKMIAQNMENPEYQLKLHKENHPNEIKKISNKKDINMKIIDDMMIESTRETNQNIHEKLESLKKKAVFCKFTKRDPEIEGKNSCKMKLQWPSMRRYNSEKKMNSISNNFQATFSKKLLEKSIHEHAHETSMGSNIQQKENKLNLNQLNGSLTERLQTRSRSNSMNVLNNISMTNRVKSTRKTAKKVPEYEQSPVKKDLVNETKKLIEKKHQLKSFLYTEDLANQTSTRKLAQIIGKTLNCQR